MVVGLLFRDLRNGFYRGMVKDWSGMKGEMNEKNRVR